MIDCLCQAWAPGSESWLSKRNEAHLSFFFVSFSSFYVFMLISTKEE